MKKLISLVIAIGAFFYVSAHTELNNFKAPINEELVPIEIADAFWDNHQEQGQEVKWYPYPYQFPKESNLNKSYFSAINLHRQPDFYEVAFKKGDQEARKVYNLNGVCRLEVSLLDETNLPSKIDSTLEELGYDMWGKRTFEEIIDLEKESKKYYKLLITSMSKTRAIYFDEEFNLEKTRKWEMSNLKYQKSTVFLKTAYQGSRQMIDAAMLPDLVNEGMRRDLDFANVIEFWEVEPVHIPEHRTVLEYYDVELSPIHEVVYLKRKKTFKSSYNNKGELLETVEIINWEDLPKYVVDVATEVKYMFWVFEKNIEKVKLEDGSYCYRLHAKEFGEPQMFVINKK